jgi:predicted esterase
VIDASVEELEKEHGGEVDGASPRVLVGFSLGGIAAIQVLRASPPGRYAGLVVVASQIHPEAAALKRAGVQRVVFAAGDFDVTSAPLKESAAALERCGVPTRFVSLGRFGHGYPADMKERMKGPMEWVAGG